MGYDISLSRLAPEVDEARGIAYALPRDSDERRTAFDTLLGIGALVRVILPGQHLRHGSTTNGHG